MRDADERYFERLESQLDDAIDVAERAKALGDDPKPEVEIPTARDMADRVENILGIPGVAERVRELEDEMSREEAALELVTDFVEGRVGDYESKAGKVEGAVRTAVALLTEGVVAAPIEGIDRVEVLENDDGTEFVNVYYAGPIRSAGGTAQALSVLVADYARALLDIDQYKARDEEVERYAEEIALYDKETGLQYSPKDEESRFIAEHMPIMLDGEATGDEEVSGYRDLERVDTNSARGGMCLVAAEGIALKAPKIQRYTRNLDEVDWPWLQDLIDGTIGDGEADQEAASDDAKGDAASGDDEAAEAEDAADADEPAGPPRVEESWKYLRDLIAGRPVFSHPSESGGFRLRYGRARNHGFATAGVHPATMHVVDDFLATGTQIKTERPGKAAGVVPVDSIEGPTVRLANGDVRRIDDVEEAEALANGVEKIVDLGEYLVNYGEFVENNHPLAPASYTVEWWLQEFADAGANVQALRDSPRVDLEHPDAAQALEWAREYDVPLHPTYTYCWHDLTVEEFERLAAAVADARVEPATDDDPFDGDLLVLDREPDPREGSERQRGGAAMRTDGGPLGGERDEEPSGPRSLRAVVESLLVEHRQTDDELRIPDFEPLVRSLGLERREDGARTDGGVVTAREPFAKPWNDLPEDAREWPNAMRAVEAVAPFAVRERAPTRVGNRMGRPEKSESRDLSPAVHTLFPIGEAGGSQRDVSAAAGQYDATETTERGDVEVEVGRRECPDCEEHTFETTCPECGSHTEPHYLCPDCEQRLHPDDAGRVHCDRCERDGSSVETKVIDLKAEYQAALDAVGERENAFDVLKGVKGLMSSDKTPEPIEKGVLRAKHGVTAFKDGTVRYDMTDLPVTAVRASELDVTVDALRGLGYETDVHGDPLRHEDQLVELKVQDVVLSDGAAEHMLQTADFVDDLLESYYGLEPFYDLEERDELVGELVFGMAPHTSAATVGRVVGFTSAAVGYAHPYFHAAKRRNCFHPDTEIHYRTGDEYTIREWKFTPEEVPDDEEPRTATIEEFVESRLEDPREDDFGTLVQELDEDVDVVSYHRGLNVPNRVTAVSKHPAPDHLVEVETEAGQTLRVTPDHEMLRRDDTIDMSFENDDYRSERVPASELEAGDVVPTPAVPAPTSEGGIPDYTFSPTDEANSYPPTATDWQTLVRVEPVESEVEYVYCLEVEDAHTVCANGIHTAQCDGDEDCVMLLMDGLLNFSKQFLPDKRGGQMDAPLVMSSRIDPSEIDDEAHNMDVMWQYPKEFYEATREMADPEAVEDIMTIAEENLDTDREYTDFFHTHDTTDIHMGPALSAYKTLGSMEEKMDAQLDLSRKLRAVDETDVAERIIEFHFLPDLIGNLRAFSRQETRCLDCGEKYRRMPLTGDCRECGGDVNLTVHEGSVNKYMQTAINVADDFGARTYTKQRLEVLERSLDRVFENDKNRKSTLGDFM